MRQDWLFNQTQLNNSETQQPDNCASWPRATIARWVLSHSALREKELRRTSDFGCPGNMDSAKRRERHKVKQRNRIGYRPCSPHVTIRVRRRPETSRDVRKAHSASESGESATSDAPHGDGAEACPAVRGTRRFASRGKGMLEMSFAPREQTAVGMVSRTSIRRQHAQATETGRQLAVGD